MPKLILCVGIPASGKTTYAINWVAGDPDRLRVNRDSLRYMMFGSYWGEGVDERFVTETQMNIVRRALHAGKDVIIDDTNLNDNVRSVFRGTARTYLADFELVFFDVDVEEAIRRNAARDRRVPDDVIRNMHDRYLKIRQ